MLAKFQKDMRRSMHAYQDPAIAIANKCMAHPRVLGFAGVNERGYQAEIARVILDLGKNQNAISAPCALRGYSGF